MLGTPIWPDMRVPGPRLKNPGAIPVMQVIFSSLTQRLLAHHVWAALVFLDFYGLENLQ